MHLAELGARLAPSRGNVTCFLSSFCVVCRLPTRRPVLRKVGICRLGISSTSNNMLHHVPEPDDTAVEKCPDMTERMGKREIAVNGSMRRDLRN